MSIRVSPGGTTLEGHRPTIPARHPLPLDQCCEGSVGEWAGGGVGRGRRAVSRPNLSPSHSHPPLVTPQSSSLPVIFAHSQLFQYLFFVFLASGEPVCLKAWLRRRLFPSFAPLSVRGIWVKSGAQAGRQAWADANYMKREHE
ncbi:hypothetical protein E2C01_025771 [Portunus trituberculatus]|uniref:Uncharacterized protein n=1 Tax=Portunus trituberculatus TaxID=210409 RepID=A0A5B7EDT8_PORTR|nr:hypothetical protein [Portunus trituberculatus]